MDIYNINYDNFDWENYIDINVNNDLKKNNILDKDSAWRHWKNHGIKEERPLTITNNTNIHNGRLGNLFFVNMVMHFIAVKYNLKCRYKYFDYFKKLGIELYIGKNEYKKNIKINNSNFLQLIKNNHYRKSNIIIDRESCYQTSEFVVFLKLYFNIAYNKLKIINNNMFKDRYKNNNDLFIHVRLGDIKDRTDNIEKYYEKALLELNFDKGYISSDSINDKICQNMIRKYKLNVIDKSELETIMFASTCNIIILSGGTFSWLIGFFSFFACKIYYPNMKNRWYGDIFNFVNWVSIDF